MNNGFGLSLKLLILSWITAKRQLIHNRLGLRSSWNQNYDYIVVGAGGSGCVVANRLSEDSGVSVLLLEAGGPQSAIYNDIPGMFAQIETRIPELEWFYPNQQNDPDKYYTYATGKTIGGSTSHNYMTFDRGNPRSFDRWAQKYGARGWSWKEVLPYFRKLENNTDRDIVNNNPGYHGTNGPVTITTPKNPDQILLEAVRVLTSLGFKNQDLNAANQTGTTLLQSYVDKSGFRAMAGNAYIDPNPHPNNLHIVTKAMVIKVLFNGLKAVGVELVRNDTSYKVYVRREIILSGGKFSQYLSISNSSQLITKVM